MLDAEVRCQCIDKRGVAFERCLIARRRFGEAMAGQVDGDEAIVGLQAFDPWPPCVHRCGKAVDEDERARATRAFVRVVNFYAG